MIEQLATPTGKGDVASLRPLRIALYSGIFVASDAISISLGLKLSLLTKLREHGVPVEVTVFTHASDSRDAAVHRVTDAAALLRDDRFRAADVHMFEFGIHYPLFDCVFLIPPEQLKVGIFHNVTPPELAENSEQRALLWTSMEQRSNLFSVDRVPVAANSTEICSLPLASIPTTCPCCICLPHSLLALGRPLPPPSSSCCMSAGPPLEGVDGPS